MVFMSNTSLRKGGKPHTRGGTRGSCVFAIWNPMSVHYRYGKDVSPQADKTKDKIQHKLSIAKRSKIFNNTHTCSLPSSPTKWRKLAKDKKQKVPPTSPTPRPSPGGPRTSPIIHRHRSTHSHYHHFDAHKYLYLVLLLLHYLSSTNPPPCNNYIPSWCASSSKRPFPSRIFHSPMCIWQLPTSRPCINKVWSTPHRYSPVSEIAWQAFLRW